MIEAAQECRETDVCLISPDIKLVNTTGPGKVSTITLFDRMLLKSLAIPSI